MKRHRAQERALQVRRLTGPVRRSMCGCIELEANGTSDLAALRKSRNVLARADYRSRSGRGKGVSWSGRRANRDRAHLRRAATRAD